MCSHHERRELDVEEIIRAIKELEPEELKLIKAEVDQRVRASRKSSGQTQSIILEYRPYQDGQFTLEERLYKKTGRSRGPYWYFHYHEGGKQRKLYLGKTDNPEAALMHKRHTQSSSAGGISSQSWQTTEAQDVTGDQQARGASE